MKAIDPFASSHALLTEAGAPLLLERIEQLAGDLEPGERERIEGIISDRARSPESLRDAVSTRLMECFRLTQSRRAFGLLYELSGPHLLIQVAARLRRYGSHAEPGDVLRNTVLKHLRSLSRSGRAEVPYEDLPEQPETNEVSPLGGVIESESREECARVYLTYLQLYLRFYSMLSDRERLALHLVEVKEWSYRQTAAELEIKLENLKMVIFRARRKIHRSMRRVFDGLTPDCRPARDPSGVSPKVEQRGGDNVSTQDLADSVKDDSSQ